MNTIIKNQLKKFTLVIICFLTISHLHSQSLKKLGAGLNEPVITACSDSIGNIYAVTRNQFGDTLIINYYNKIDQTWNMINKSKLKYDLRMFKPSCFILKNAFYLTELDGYGGFYKYYMIYNLNKFSNNIWTKELVFKKESLNYPELSDLFVKKVNENLYQITGLFDTINNQSFVNHIYFDGNLISSTNSLKNYGPYSVESYKDTVFIALNNQILFQKVGTNNWNSYFTFKNSIRGLFFTDSIKYFTSNDSIYSFSKSKVINQTSLKNSNGFITAMITNNASVIIHKQTSALNHLIEIKNNKNNNIGTLISFSLSDRDTSEYNYFKTNENKIYYFSSNSIIYNNVELGNIVELSLDSIDFLTLDTIVIKQFKDNNENYVFDNGDQNLSSPFFIDNIQYNTNSNGIYNYYHFDGYNPKIQGFNFNCEVLPFSGYINSKTSSPNISIDTVNIPYFASHNVNLRIKNSSFSQARLLDTITLKFKVDNISCIYNNGSANAELQLNPNVEFISSSPNYTSKNSNIINFSIINLYNSQSREIIVKIVYPLNQFSINDVVKHYLKITPSTSDMDSTDNRDSIMQRIVYSYDPNAKYSLPEGKITSDLRKIRYTIHFQNEGNDDARKVTIIDTINLKMPVYSFQMIGATHPYLVSIQPGTNIVTWVFDNINLKPKSENEEKSKGYLVFEANVRGDLRVGDSIRNKAYIYFDYNEPIITNYAVIARVENESGGGTNVAFLESKIKSILVYPNPASSVLTIKNLKNENITFEIFNAMGQSVFKDDLNAENSSVLNVEALSKGIYFIVTSIGDQLKFIIQ